MTHAQSSLRAAASDQAVVYPQGWCRSLPTGGRAPSSQPTLPTCPSLPIRGSALIYSGAEPFQLSLASIHRLHPLLCNASHVRQVLFRFVTFPTSSHHWCLLLCKSSIIFTVIVTIISSISLHYYCCGYRYCCIYIHTYNDNWYLASMHAFNLIGHYSLNYPQAELAAKITTSGEIIVFIKARSFYCWIQYF